MEITLTKENIKANLLSKDIIQQVVNIDTYRKKQFLIDKSKYDELSKLINDVDTELLNIIYKYRKVSSLTELGEWAVKMDGIYGDSISNPEKYTKEEIEDMITVYKDLDVIITCFIDYDFGYSMLKFTLNYQDGCGIRYRFTEMLKKLN